VAFAVNVVEVAMPFAPVVSVSVASPFAKVPLAPDAGAVNVTSTPAAGVPFEVTLATSGSAKASPNAALCLVPFASLMEVGEGEEDPPQLVRKPMATQIKAGMPA
jgi:hypothetical protein